MENDFFLKVYEVAKDIPLGKVTTYGAIAKKIGAPKSARMVGYALNNSKNLDNIPAHRVVNRNGTLTGKFHFEGTNLMQQLLENESFIIKENTIQNFKENLWIP